MLLWFMSQNVLLVFYEFYGVTSYILSLQAIFSLFLCMVWGCVLTSLIYMQPSSFPNTTCWRDCLFSIVYSCPFCQRLIDHRCVDLFRGSLFCCNGRLQLFFFSLEIALGSLGLLLFHRHFRIIHSSSVKNIMSNLIRIMDIFPWIIFYFISAL